MVTKLIYGAANAVEVTLDHSFNLSQLYVH